MKILKRNLLFESFLTFIITQWELLIIQLDFVKMILSNINSPKINGWCHLFINTRSWVTAHILDLLIYSINVLIIISHNPVTSAATTSKKVELATNHILELVFRTVVLLSRFLNHQCLSYNVSKSNHNSYGNLWFLVRQNWHQ